MSEPFIKEYTGTGGWVALESTHIGFKGTLTADVANGAANSGNNVLIRVDSQTGSHLIPGEFLTFDPPISLSRIQIMGNTFVLKVMGTTDKGW